MDEKEKQALSALKSGDRMEICPYADKKHYVQFRRVDMAKETLTVHGDFSVHHQVLAVNDMSPKVIKQVGERTYSFDKITSWKKVEEPKREVPTGSIQGLTAEQKAALETWEQTGKPTPGVEMFYPNLESPTEFFQVVDGRTVVHSCPNGQHFNAYYQVCDWPENIQPVK